MSLQTYDHIYQPPAGEDPTTLVLLHGTGGDARSFLEIGRMIAPTAAKLSIDGNVDENGMARFFRRTGEGTYDMEDLARRTNDLGEFITAALVHHGRDPSTAIGIGYSNGANILANLAFTQPDILARQVLMHPLIPFEPDPPHSLDDTAILITEGAQDPISPTHLTDRLEVVLSAWGATVDRFRHPGGHELRNEEIAAASAWIAGLARDQAA